MTSTEPWWAVVVAGGTGRRLRGADKAALVVAGVPLLQRVLASVTPADRVVVVGPQHRPDADPALLWAREDPPGGGPLAGFGAGVRTLTGAIGAQPNGVVVLLAVDHPFVQHAPRLLAEALSARPDLDAVLARADDGRRQPLLAAYRVRAIATTPAAELTGRSMHGFVATLRVADLAVDPRETFDIDTPEDLAAAAGHLPTGEE